jgi:RNA polymerase sigma factor (sigma-70 family)
MEINWPQLVLSEAFFQRVNKLVQKSIVDDTAAEEAVTYIIQTLSENNWEKCRGFTGKSSPETFLYSVSSNLIIDYSRKLYGRERPPAWFQRKGPLWLAIWKELCLDRQPIEMVITKHSQDHTRDRPSLEHIIQTIKAKLPWCGVSKRPESLDDEEGGAGKNLTGALQGGDLHEQAQIHRAMEFAHLLLGGSEGGSSADDESALEFDGLQGVLSSINLTAEEKLLLKMHFCDGMSFSAIARSLGMAKHQPVRLIKQILERVKQQLISNGIDIEPVRVT